MEGEASDIEIGTARLEAFSDSVLAVIMTIMAFNLHAPAGSSLHSLSAHVPEFLVYVLSFAILAIYWNNHHHMLRAARRINGVVMWANLFLLFWLSLIPVLTKWVAASYDAALPAASYGACALAAALAYTVLTRAIITADVPGSRVAAAVGSDRKGKASVLLYAGGVALAFVTPYVAYGCYTLVALIWFVPDRRFSATS